MAKGSIKPRSSKQIRHRPVVKPSTSKPEILSKEEREELKRLAECLPMVMQQKNDDPASIVFNAASYIDRLVSTITAKVKSGALPPEALQNIAPQVTVTRRPQKSQKVTRRRRS
ncbi:unnamed protein product [Bursaphelenchus okinawaensis]|uniref:Uncharacterized protein n=1 Tax=Bursaphelenchus okinawaensis TaxID=465554 RepID=A0A811KVC5_9BILA|nr:unnamed protein product [Bursaphelenchus okinawaensis]CAG9112418.1 unnamed protein product [Bursaphelenchus okinawaensis]